MNINIEEFKEYCQSRNWIFDEFTSEFTFQFRLCRFIEGLRDGYQIELESNIERLNIIFIHLNKEGSKISTFIKNI